MTGKPLSGQKQDASRPQAGGGLSHESIFVARQPVLDREASIYGYELLFRHSNDASSAEFLDPDAATAQVIVDGLAIASKMCEERSRFLINFPANLLTQGAAELLPKERCVIEILETVEPSEEVLAVCMELKHAGCVLALDDFVGGEGYEAFLELADIVKVDILGLSTQELIGLVQRLKTRDCKLLAERVEDARLDEMARALGFTYFQGDHYAQPKIIKGRTLTASRASKMLLLREVADDLYEVKKVAQIIHADVSLTYRLLRFINSAAYGFRTKITSVEQAVSAMGSKALKQWLLVALISDMAAAPGVQAAMSFAVQRAKFLEILARSMKKPPMEKETMFLLGLFSNLDLLLGIPMAEIVTELPFPEEVKQTLMGEKTKARIWLDLALELERGKMDILKQLAQSMKVKPGSFVAAHGRAGIWARELLSNSPTDSDVPGNGGAGTAAEEVA